jgi:hypothetical protein
MAERLRRDAVILVVALAAASLLPWNAAAQQTGDSESVSHLRAEVVREGAVTLSGTGPASDLNVTLSVPQNSSRQSSFVKSLSGPDSYSLITDEWDNTRVVLHWASPAVGTPLGYTLVSEVEVSGGDIPSTGRAFPTTALTDATPEISRKAYDVAAGREGIEVPFGLAEWVHKWLRYDSSAGSFAESAAWAYSHRIGVCDEYSVLLISMLRELGYDAYYVVGYARSDSWGQHGWVEADWNGTALSLDPTWLESPVDAAHIELARMPDSNLSEYVEVKGAGVRIGWDKKEPRIRELESQEKPRLAMELKAVPAQAGSGSHVMLEAGLTATGGGCVLSYVRARPCTVAGHPFLYGDEENKTAAFCGSGKLYWVFGLPGLQEGTDYSCPVAVFGGGAQGTATVRASSDAAAPMEITLATPSVVLPGQRFNVSVQLRNSGPDIEAAFYLLFWDGVLSEPVSVPQGGASGLTAGLNAPGYPGEYVLRVFAEGSLAEQPMTVVDSRSLYITNVSLPSEAAANEGFRINVTVASLDNETLGRLRVTAGGKLAEERIDLGRSGTASVPASLPGPGPGRVEVILLSGDGRYQDGWRGDVKVAAGGGQAFMGWLQEMTDSIFKALSDALGQIAKAARSIMMPQG